MVTNAKTTHKKGQVAPGKVNRNWRINIGIDQKLHDEAVRQGYGEKGVATLVNNHFTRYFNGETIRLDPENL